MNEEYLSWDLWKQSVREVLQNQWKVLPGVLVLLGCLSFGVMFLIVEVSFDDPATSEQTARIVYRLIGVVFIIAPVWLLYRGRTGYYDDE